ncbi:branched-chain amino acid transporter AzlD [Quadrisphaera sp. DSM 44207]|uniref:branched-chain amino acid transporter AzlD n=1 Tax=Quadrisphaera sp. DSM 44207 TaxID=1881057 RepID=UPI0008836A36|nr:branched-chain amino acid transporter AzlD [Quadrisphaera sp. DSM 44207]SDQ77260.1 hypothetical protein SAMN05428996_2749 [Quadrisphaera sp. DSM 44207]
MLVASAACFAVKLAGHLAPPRWLDRPGTARAAALGTVALLAALTAVQALADGRSLVPDARVPALLVAAAALALRAPFLLAVVLAAATAAMLRSTGWG